MSPCLMVGMPFEGYACLSDMLLCDPCTNQAVLILPLLYPSQPPHSSSTQHWMYLHPYIRSNHSTLCTSCSNHSTLTTLYTSAAAMRLWQAMETRASTHLESAATRAPTTGSSARGRYGANGRIVGWVLSRLLGGRCHDAVPPCMHRVVQGFLERP